MRWLVALSLLPAAGCALFDAAGQEGGGDETCEEGESARSSQATYDPSIVDGGNCTFGPSSDLMVVGLSEFDYQGSLGCGGCLEVERTGVAAIVVRAVDSCLACNAGELVLSAEAFQMLEPDLDVGVIPVTWHWVECEEAGPLSIHFKEGSDDQWLAVQVRDHRHRVASLEAQVSGAGSWLALDRADYNYFIADPGIGFGPLDFRITDVFGHEVIETGMEVASDVLRAGSQQFPSCR
jgi:expansin (peptidoglycan-binding protein)